MVKTLEQAMEQLSRLPDADQEQIGRKLISHVEKLNALRTDIERGIRSLDAGKGRECYAGVVGRATPDKSPSRNRTGGGGH